MRRRLIWWLVGGGLLLVVVLAVGLSTQRWMNGSSTGSVHMGTPLADQSAPATPTQPRSVQTQYFTTTLPAGFSIKRQAETPAADQFLAQLVASSTSTQDQQCAVTIGRLPAGGLQALGDYHLRATDAAAYQAYAPAYLPSGASAFRTASGPLSITVFWPHGSVYSELAVSTDTQASLQQLDSTVATAIAAWKWAE
ncbi:MAG TPA: hypothetical protein VLF69_05105 [Candidatus Saccharimonadales bacterium]|nr:hypothetical protein [Candidatus Saccharimonadales bacterium]